MDARPSRVSTTQPLRRLIDPRRPITYGIVQAGENVPDGVPYVRPVDMTDRHGVADPAALLRTSPEIASQYSRSEVRENDLVMSIGPSYGKVMEVPESLAGANLTQGTARLAPGPLLHGRWLYWFLQSAPAREYWSIVVSGATFAALNLGPLGNTPTPVVALERQRRIADFLDDQVARIDNIIAAREQQGALLRERSSRLLDESFAVRGVSARPGMTLDQLRSALPEGWRAGELGHVLRHLTNGYVGPTRDLLVDEGVRYIQSLHIKDGRIDFARRPYFVPQVWHDERPRIHLRAEDVLIVQTGDIGQVAVVPRDFGAASCHALLIARVEPEVISGEYLGEFLRSPIGRQGLLSRATGALHPHLESGIKTAPVVIPPIGLQPGIVAEIAANRSHIDEGRALLTEHIGFLRELKGSLITAAVSGEFDVSSSDGSRVPV